jgi:hypothetical protein
LKRFTNLYHSYKLDIAALITLAAILIRIISELTQYLDVLFLDDSFYMMAGVKFFELPYKAFGQVYRFRFWLMHLWEPDLVNLYYLNYKISILISPLLLFIYLRRINTHVLVAFLITFFYSVSHVHVTTWPRVSHMCIEVILLALITSTFIKSTYYRLFLFVLTALFLSYIRNEFFLSFLLLFLPFIGWGFFQIFREKKYATIPLTLIVGVLYFVVSKKLGNPMAGDGAGRAVVAFGQHFAYNYVTWNNLNEPFWVTWIDIMQRVFGDLVDFKTAFQTNKLILLKHLTSNVQNFALNHLQYLGDLILPNSIIKINASVKIIFAGMIFIFWSKKYPNKEAKQAFSDNKVIFTLGVLLLILLPTFASSFLIYPRDHYLIMQVLLVVLFIVLSLNTLQITLQNSLIILLVFLFAFMIAPKAEKFDYFNLLRKNEGRPNYAAIDTLNSIYKGNDTLTIFEHEGGIINFIEGSEDKKRWLSRLGMDTTFIPYIQREKVNVIYHSDFMSLDPKIDGDNTWHLFIENPEQYGFRKVVLENSPESRYLLIDKTLD